MYKSIYIKKLFAFLLFLVFALSNTPTKYLHHLFANHKDFVNKNSSWSDTLQWNVSGINCHCESNVVIAPYTFQDAIVIKTILPVFTEFTYSDNCGFVHSQSISFGLRGPPFLT